MKYERDRYEYELSALSFDLTSYDVIHTQDVVSTRAFARIKPKNVPLVATVHGCFTREFGLRPTSEPGIVGVLRKPRACWRPFCRQSDYADPLAEELVRPGFFHSA